MTQAQTFHQFATAKAHAGRFDDIQDVKSHYSDLQYMSWIGSALQEYRNYLTDNFPTMTLAQAAELTARSTEQEVA